MGGRADPGLTLTARVLPCAILVLTRYTDKELARYRRTLTSVARGEDVSIDEMRDSVTEGGQGLGGVTIGAFLLGAMFGWGSEHVVPVPLMVLSAVSVGVAVLTGSLAAIYAGRVLWRRTTGAVPRPFDFWVAVGCGLLITPLVLAGQLASS